MDRVIAGDYINNGLYIEEKVQKFKLVTNIFISVGWKKDNWIKIDKDTVEEYEILDEDKQKSAVSAVGRALVGSVLLGGVGLLAGVTAKSKGTYRIAIQFKDGKKSLIEVGDKTYKKIMEVLF